MSYRDILARSQRQRPDGSPVWPLTFLDRPTAPSVASPAPRRPQLRVVEADAELTYFNQGGRHGR